MNDFYTVDRLGTLTAAGAKLELRTFNNVMPPLSPRHVNAIFPDGVSRHGDRNFLTQPGVAWLFTDRGHA